LATDLDFDVEVTPEFLTEGNKDEHRKNKRGGPYNKTERSKRQNEVAKLHFEYGYSARRIADMMKVNRATINNDIQFLFDEFSKRTSLDPSNMVMRQIMSLEAQKTRLRNMLDDTKPMSEVLKIERTILEIDSKIINAYSKVTSTELRIHRRGIDFLNQQMKSEKKDRRYLSLFDTNVVSSKAKERINRIIKEDQQRL